MSLCKQDGAASQFGTLSSSISKMEREKRRPLEGMEDVVPNLNTVIIGFFKGYLRTLVSKGWSG
jgi:hypothetical protein